MGVLTDSLFLSSASGIFGLQLTKGIYWCKHIFVGETDIAAVYHCTSVYSNSCLLICLTQVAPRIPLTNQPKGCLLNSFFFLKNTK